jgi:hypothetical protein
VLHLGDEPYSLLIRNKIITKVKLLKLDKVDFAVEHISMDSCKLVSAKVESLELRDLAHCLKKECWVYER